MRDVDTLFFDGSCPLCRREVELVQRVADEMLAFQDIHALPEDGPFAREDLLKSLHLRRGNGEMVTGLEANVAVWQHTRFGVFWRLLLVPGIRTVAEWAYSAWAQRRYARLYGCVGR